MHEPQQAFLTVPSTASVIIDVDLDALSHNYHFVRRHIGPQCLCVPVVKADAYGLGATSVSKRLFQEGARAFFVATLEEGISLREILPLAEIYVLSSLWEAAVPEMRAARLTPVLSSNRDVRLWQGMAKTQGEPLPALLQVETGLLRLGLSLADIQQMALNPSLFEALQLKAMMSHLACAYEPGHPYNREQQKNFDTMHAYFPQMPASLAGSGGLFQGRSYLYDMVRPGRILYGSTFTAPEPFVTSVQPVVEIHARILQIQDVKAGQSIGYDQTFRASQPMRIAVLGMGYADGYFRSLSNRAWGYLGGYKTPVVGRVSMDSMVVDITAVPDALLQTCEWVTLLNKEDLTIDAIAELAGTVSWEFLTRLGSRPFFRYKGISGKGAL